MPGTCDQHKGGHALRSGLIDLCAGLQQRVQGGAWPFLNDWSIAEESKLRCRVCPCWAPGEQCGLQQRGLQRLDTAGLISSTRVGNLRRFPANHDYPVYAELHNLVQKSFGLTGVLQTAIESLLPSLHCAFVYGSIARGAETAVSDIDVMLIGDTISYGAALSAFSTAEQDLGRKINPTLYTPAEFRKRQQEQQHFLMRVLEQPKLFLMGDEARCSSARYQSQVPTSAK